jgi:predicted RNA-binding protein with PUA-like domain
LETMSLVRRGNSLSSIPVSQHQWDFILSREDQPSEI